MKRRAFTLIELLVVIAIIGILSALIIISLQGGQKKAGDADRKVKAKSLATAIEQYAVDQNKYPIQEGVTTDGNGLEIQSEDGQSCSSLLLTSLVTLSGTKRYLQDTGTCLDRDPLITHQYKSVDGNLGKYYLIAWQLKYQNERYIDVTQHGNGVYQAPGGAACTEVQDGPPLGSGWIKGHEVPTTGTRITITCLPISRYFVVYGPQ